MKTKIELNGYEIEIEESEGIITVKAEKDGEVIEEFSLEPISEDGEKEESEDEEGDIKSFDAFGGDEEEDLGSDTEGDEDESEDDDDDDESDQEDEEELDDKALESFQSFVNKIKK